MKNILLVICIVLVSCIQECYAQVLRVDNGVSFSWTNFGSKKNASYIGAVGLDYLEREHFMLCSRIGILSKEENALLYGPLKERMHVKIDYFNINTTARFKQPIFKGDLFIGFGPSFDFKRNSEYRIINAKGEQSGEDEYLSQDFVFGFLAETGYFMDINRWRVELNLNYRNNITKILPITRKGFISHSLALSVGLGYAF